MRGQAISMLLVGILFVVGCGTDEISAPTSSSSSPSESQFPVSEEFPGFETRLAPTKKVSGDLVDTAIEAGFSTLVRAVQAAGLEGALRDGGPWTVFAPTNEAFENLPTGFLEQLLLDENKDKLAQILKYHVVSGAVKRSDLSWSQSVETLEGSDLRIRRFFRLVVVNDAWVKMADVMATNGVIHVIDKVLVPDGFTLEDPVEPELDLFDTAVQAGFTKLVEAVEAAGLKAALQGDEPLTIFAPTNAAFEDLPSSVVAELQTPGNEDLLQELLLYHVTLGDIRSTDLRRFQIVEMLGGGDTVVYKAYRGRVYVNFSRVTTPDVLATNGVIHVINRVLIPPSFYGRLKSLPSEAPALPGPAELEL